MKKGLIVLILVMAPLQNAAAQMFKCTDAAGKVTYTGTKCSDLGLKDAGEVKDRVQVTPAYRPPPSPPAKAAAPAPASIEKPAATEEPKPERRCFTTNVGGKSVTRCNDKPDEPE